VACGHDRVALSKIRSQFPGHSRSESSLIIPVGREATIQSTGLATRFSIKKLNLDTNPTYKNCLMVMPIELINSGKIYLIIGLLIGEIIYNIFVTIA
jgi:hypothetical protein